MGFCGCAPMGFYGCEIGFVGWWGDGVVVCGEATAVVDSWWSCGGGLCCGFASDEREEESREKEKNK